MRLRTIPETTIDDEESVLTYETYPSEDWSAEEPPPPWLEKLPAECVEVLPSRRRDQAKLRPAVATLAAAPRMLPSAPDQERGLLSSIFHAPDRVIGSLVEERVTEDYFHQPSHAAIYRQMLAMWNARTPIELISVTTELEKAGVLEAVGGASAVTEIFSFILTAANWQYYRDTLRECWAAREAISIATAITEAAYAPGGHTQLLEITQQALMRIAATQESRAETRHVGEIVQAYSDHLEKIIEDGGNPGIMTGISPLDEALNGIQPGNLITIAAQTKRGKSTLALNIATHAAREGHPVGMLSLEMSAMEIGRKLLGADAHVDMNKVLKRRAQTEEMKRLSAACHRLHDLPLYVRDESVVTNLQFRAAVRRLAHQQKCRLIVVDYIQLFTPEVSEKNRERQVAETSRLIKTTASELGVAIIALSQLNQNDRSRESTAIESDADAFIIIEEIPINKPEGTPAHDENGVPRTDHYLYIKHGRLCQNQRIPVTFDKVHGVFRERFV